MAWWDFVQNRCTGNVRKFNSDEFPIFRARIFAQRHNGKIGYFVVTGIPEARTRCFYVTKEHKYRRIYEGEGCISGRDKIGKDRVNGGERESPSAALIAAYNLAREWIFETFGELVTIEDNTPHKKDPFSNRPTVPFTLESLLHALDPELCQDPSTYSTS